MNDASRSQQWWRTGEKKERVLARRRRFRRTDELPRCLAQEAAYGMRYPHRLDIGMPGVTVRYRRTVWHKLDHGYVDVPELRTRHTVAWINEGRCRMGAVELVEYDAQLMFPEAFFEAMDNESMECARIADVLVSCWNDFDADVAGYGPVLELRTVWSSPRASHPEAWRAAAHALIDAYMPGCSILFAHAYPLEYEGRLPPGVPAQLGFDRRNRAMMRLAEQEFGLQPLPGPPGAEGFLWCPRPGLERIITADGYEPDWREA